MATIDAAEKMHAERLDLIAARTPQRGIAEKVEIGVISPPSRDRIVSSASARMPDALAVPEDHCGCQQPVGAALKPCELRCGGGVVGRLAGDLAIDFQYLVGRQQKCPGWNSVHLGGRSPPFISARITATSPGQSPRRRRHAGSTLHRSARAGCEGEAGLIEQTPTCRAGGCEDQRPGRQLRGPGKDRHCSCSCRCRSWITAAAVSSTGPS